MKVPALAALALEEPASRSVGKTGFPVQRHELQIPGALGSKARLLTLEHFSAVPLLAHDRDDYIEAATPANDCRRAGVQAGTIDALIAQLCIRHSLTLLSTDRDFEHIAKHSELKIWQASV